ncbi:MAG: hypothetical protein SNJ66_10345 [Chloroherpetonaceae bacterium]
MIKHQSFETFTAFLLHKTDDTDFVVTQIAYRARWRIEKNLFANGARISEKKNFEATVIEKRSGEGRFGRLGY